MSALKFHFGSASWGAQDDVVVATRSGAGAPEQFYLEALARSDEVAAEIEALRRPRKGEVACWSRRAT